MPKHAISHYISSLQRLAAMLTASADVHAAVSVTLEGPPAADSEAMRQEGWL